MSLEETLGGLIVLLEQEADFYEDLLSLSKEEQKAVVEGNVDELNKKVKEKERLILEINRLEKTRLPLFETLSSHFKVSVGDLTLSKLSGLVPEKYSSQLKGLQEKITEKMSLLKAVNESNLNLIKGSLDYIDFSLNLLTSQPESGPVYKEDGKTKEGGRIKITDKKV